MTKEEKAEYQRNYYQLNKKKDKKKIENHTIEIKKNIKSKKKITIKCIT